MKRTTHSRIAAVLVAAMILLSCLLCGCSKAEKGFPIAVSPLERSYYELCATKYKDNDLEQIYKLMVDKNDMEKLNKQYPVECLRKDDDGYHIIYVGSKKILVLYFDSQAQWREMSKLGCMFFVTKSRGYFDALEVGDPITDVQTIDPVCFFPFLLTGSGEPKVSDHYTEDGYHTHITYDDDLNIATISYDVG